jgi:hypothetical protein
MPKPTPQVSRISLEEFTEVTLNSVVRAMEARSRPDRKFPFGPIIFGIIWYPESPTGLPGEIIQPPISRTSGQK